MALKPTPEVTKLLTAWSQGDEQALEQLMPLVYQELRRLAKRYMAFWKGRARPPGAPWTAQRAVHTQIELIPSPSSVGRLAHANF